MSTTLGDSKLISTNGYTCLGIWENVNANPWHVSAFWFGNIKIDYNSIRDNILKKVSSNPSLFDRRISFIALTSRGFLYSGNTYPFSANTIQAASIPTEGHAYWSELGLTKNDTFSGIFVFWSWQREG